MQWTTYIIKPSQSKIAEFDLSFIVDEDVGTLNVTMKKVFTMSVVQAFQHLLHDGGIKRVRKFNLERKQLLANMV